MSARTSMIAELEDAIKHGSVHARIDVLYRITELFQARSDDFTEEEVAHFDEIFIHLIDQIEARALVALSERLARIDNAPRQVIRHLAHHDEIMVAGPVLANSRRIEESDLVAIAKSKGQAHLFEISDRARIEEPVTDVLVDRGDDEVVRHVAANLGAKFSEHGFAILARRAESDDVLAQCVGERPDVPLHVFCDLLSRASKTVQQHLLARGRPEMHDEIRRVVANISGTIAARIPTIRDYAEALRAVAAMYTDGRLGEQDVFDLARSARLEEIVAALSLLCLVPIEVVDRIIWGKRIDPILVICKVAGFKWPTVRAIIQLPGKRTPSPHQLADASNDYARLSQASSRKVLQFWRDRQEAWANAMEADEAPPPGPAVFDPGEAAESPAA